MKKQDEPWMSKEKILQVSELCIPAGGIVHFCYLFAV